MVLLDAAAAGDLALAAARVWGRVLYGARANAEARRNFAPLYLRNTLANAGAMARGTRADAFDGVWTGRPVVVVGAGPSLDEALPALAAAGSRAVVVATDTALRPLLHAGITPQVVVGADPSASNARHFAALPPCDETWLVAESALDPRAAAAFPGRTAWFRVAAHDPWPWLTTEGLDVPVVEMWGSVLTAAYQVALRGGADPVVFVGADLAFTGDRPYARGTTYEFDWGYTATLGASLAEAWRRQTGMTRTIAVPGIDGRPVATSQALVAFRDWLVAQAARAGRQVVNATGGGILAGPAITQARLADVLAGRPLLPRPPVPVRPTTSAAPRTLAAAIDRVRRALASGDEAHPLLARWRASTGGPLDGAALDAALGGALEALEQRAPGMACAWLPWTALCAANYRLSRLRHLADDLAPGAAHPPPAVEAVVQAGVLLISTVPTLADGGGAEPTAEAPGNGDPRQAAWPAPVAWPLRVFDSVLPPDAAPVPGGYFDRGVADASDGAGPRSAADVLVSRLHARWLRAAAAHHEGDTAARLRGLARALDEHPSAATPFTQAIATAGAGAGTSWRLPRLGAARALTGLLLRPTEAAPVAMATLRAGDVEVGVSLPGSCGLVTPAVLTERGLPAVSHVYAWDGGVVAVPVHGTASVWIGADGAMRPHLTWPAPIVGELPMDGGAVAWSNGTQSMPALGAGYVLYRPSPDGPVTRETLPFRPTAGVWWNGRLHWTTFRTGLGAWAPGAAPEWRLDDECFCGLVSDGTSLTLAPATRDAAGLVVRRRHERALRLDADGRVAAVSLPPEGAAASIAAGPDWTAAACPDADVIRLARDGVRLDLVCHFPMAVAWAGTSLVVRTAPGDVLLFEGLAGVLDALA
ncbi:MAG: 6-hydroxymethylpterin diphosphokinase MptE-like protein [Vicinamibacterales bacterium]